MKKLFISFITLCAVSALTLVGLPAQAQDVRLGYCNGDELGSSIRAQGTESDDNELGAAIFLPKSLLKKFIFPFQKILFLVFLFLLATTVPRASSRCSNTCTEAPDNF